MEPSNDTNKNPTDRSGEVITRTISIYGDVLTEPTIYISQEAFSLGEADYLRIKRGGSVFSSWAPRILLASIGMALIPIAKHLQATFLRTTSAIEAWEWIAPLLGIGLALIFYVLGEYVPFIPNEKKQVMNEMEEHFSRVPKVRHIGEGKK